ncbi:LysR family transcriptional regulator [Noviherbaspirillum sedimenti]|uniref:LysR family transcriptional regulator n=1 Tax=Noviherbaspirillum sedimenti TaxID=2320865 RepID=A0A3A3G678_9BURK|nr:LysR family transcriptional regulator [Noviherbaspirillum sedimenti]RJG03324.1 LysR family transcriptional regulator [Noviherbaspirillum sedimenti]
MQIDLVQLRTFVAVAEEQHLTRAAERLYISLSAASAHVRAVEERLDTKLFLRTNRSLELTRAGQLLLAKAKVLLNEAALFTSFAREVHGKMEGHLAIGSSSDPTSSRIGAVVRALRDKHPLVSVDLRARPSSGTRQGLKTGELDVGMILGHPVDAGFTYYELTNVVFRVAGPAAWKEQIESATWSELAKLPWLTPADYNMAYSVMLRQLFDERGLELNIVGRFDNAALGRSMLEAGVGVMLMREEHVCKGIEQGILAVSPIARVNFPVLMAHAAGRGNDPLIRAFVDAAADVWPGLSAIPSLAEI